MLQQTETKYITKKAITSYYHRDKYLQKLIAN